MCEILHTISSLATTLGGPSRSVTSLCDHLVKVLGIEVTLLTQRCSRETIIEPAAENVRFHTVSLHGRAQAKVALGFWKELKKLLVSQRPSVIHAHGVWDATSYWSAVLARRHGARLVLHPRGMLEPWCLNYKAGKKKLAIMLYARRMLESVDLFVATAEQELQSIRALGLVQPVAMLPNGIELPEIARSEIRRVGNRQALFLSRVHQVKGLSNLIRAWAKVAPKGWSLTVAGPDEGGHWEEVKQEIDALGLCDQVTYVGEVQGEVKERLFHEADLFVLPSFSENFGIVVAEALSYGLPVITTTGTPWHILSERGCGWWVTPTVEGLEKALREATQCSTVELREMGKRAREYAQEFDWNHIARQMAEVYQWLLGAGEKPGCVILE